MEESMFAGQGCGVSEQAGVNRTTGEMVGEGGGSNGWGLRGREILKERRCPKVTSLSSASPSRVVMARLVKFLFAADLVRGIVGDIVHVAAVAGNNGGFAGVAQGE